MINAYVMWYSIVYCIVLYIVLYDIVMLIQFCKNIMLSCQCLTVAMGNNGKMSCHSLRFWVYPLSIPILKHQFFIQTNRVIDRKFFVVGDHHKGNDHADGHNDDESYDSGAHDPKIQRPFLSFVPEEKELFIIRP